MTTSSIWLFGYGSIMWKTGFEFEEREIARLDNKARRFWQGSEDHRGLPGAPGRVVTLIDAPGQSCWGMAYRIRAAQAEEIIEQLDHREKGGYQRLSVDLHFRNSLKAAGITYFATADNPHFLGNASEADIARQITASSGPSGSNLDYLQKLHQTLQAHDIVDDHVNRLAALASKLS